MLSGQSLIPELTEWVKANHPYSVPELIVAPLLNQGNTDYLSWVVANTKPEPQP
jgi:uncharacterized protein involved in tolerance to divalent cations